MVKDEASATRSVRLSKKSKDINTRHFPGPMRQKIDAYPVWVVGSMAFGEAWLFRLVGTEAGWCL